LLKEKKIVDVPIIVHYRSCFTHGISFENQQVIPEVKFRMENNPDDKDLLQNVRQKPAHLTLPEDIPEKIMERTRDMFINTALEEKDARLVRRTLSPM